MNLTIRHWTCVGLTCLAAAVLLSCKKPPGPGGKATIKGKIYVRDFNSAAYGAPIAEYYAPGETVYISYGDDTGSDNDVKTGSDGSFEFQYLRTGHYKIFANSRDTSVHISGSNKEEAVSVQTDVSSNRQIVDVGTIIINK